MLIILVIYGHVTHCLKAWWLVSAKKPKKQKDNNNNNKIVIALLLWSGIWEWVILACITSQNCCWGHSHLKVGLGLEEIS